MLLLRKHKYCNSGKQLEVSLAFGKFSQSYKKSSLRFCKFEMLLASFTFFKLITKLWRLMRYPIDVSNANLSVLCRRLPHRIRQNVLRDFNRRFLGKILIFWHPRKFQNSSSSRSPLDWWTSTKFMHLRSTTSFMFGEITDKSGTFVIFLQLVKFIYFNVSNRHLCIRRKVFEIY